MKRKIFIAILSMIFIYSTLFLNCMHSMPMMGSMPTMGQNRPEMMPAVRELQIERQFDELSVTVYIFPYPFLIYERSKISFEIVNSETGEPVRNIEIDLIVNELPAGRNMKKKKLMNQIMATNEDGYAYANIFLDSTGKYEFDFNIRQSGNVYNFNRIEYVEQTPNMRGMQGQGGILNKALIVGGGLAMVVLMVWMMSGSDIH